MLKVSKKVEYTLIVLKHMMEKEQHCSEETDLGHCLTTAREVCQVYHTPFDTTSKVMQLLNNKGYLKSIQGVKGGYMLAVDLNTVTYYDIFRLVEGNTFEDSCHGDEGSERGPCQQFENCNIRGPLNRLNTALIQFFQAITLKILFTEHLAVTTINGTITKHPQITTCTKTYVEELPNLQEPQL